MKHGITAQGKQRYRCKNPSYSYQTFDSDNFVVGVGVGSINLRVDPRFNQDGGAAGLLPACWEIFGSNLAH
jgi:hypothetical protein